uniref:Uncharacterized protein LOC104214651 n=1 Tax=Nicotiana sylvestris TaxID=4096 RepID=A0A1U7VLC7_NICSY|nr:PREDICTED: uncharacterized protein LOC104214651 [Nicotiana sylvestris]
MGLDQCRGVDRSHIHQRPHFPLHGVRLLAFLDFVFGIVALSQMPSPSAHASDSSEGDDPDDVRYDGSSSGLRAMGSFLILGLSVPGRTGITVKFIKIKGTNAIRDSVIPSALLEGLKRSLHGFYWMYGWICRVNRERRPEHLRKVGPCTIWVQGAWGIRKDNWKKTRRKMSHVEFFMETHIRKKEAPTDPTRWVEDRAENTHGCYNINLEEYTKSLPPNEQATVHFKQRSVKDMRYRAGLQGIGTSAQGEAIDRSTILSMEQKIAKLTAELEETKAREKKRDEQFGTLQVQLERRDEQFNLLQGQLTDLLASGVFPIPRSRPPSPCAGDEGSRSEDGDDAT